MKRTSKFYDFIIVIQILLLIYLTILGFVYAPIGQDASYYIVQGRDVAEGQILYRDLATQYTPLVTYILSIPYLLSPNPDYSQFYFVYYFFIILSSLIIFKICNVMFASLSLKIKFLASLLFVNLSLIQGGIYVNLEPFSSFFVLLAFYLYISHRDGKLYYLFIGILIGLSYLAKQLGGIFLLGFLLMIFFNENKKNIIPNFLLLSLGFIIPLLSLVFIHFSQSISLLNSILALLGQNSLTDGGRTGSNYTIIRFIFTMFRMYVYCYLPFSLIIILKIFKKDKVNLSSNAKSLFIVFVLSNLLLAFALNWHYFQYITPWVILITMYFLDSIKISQEKFIEEKIFILFLILNAFAMWYLSFNTYNSYFIDKPRNKQIEISLKINEVIGKGAKVYSTVPWLYFPCKFRSASPKDVGYSFPGAYKPTTVDNFLKSNSWLIIDNKYKGQYVEILGKYTLISKVDQYELYKKK